MGFAIEDKPAPKKAAAEVRTSERLSFEAAFSVGLF